MCGIAGALSFDAYRVTPEYLAAMGQTLARRGPDGDGMWVDPDGRVGMAHRRLSIVDLTSAAGQPMSNEDGSLWLTFNGEIYNHAELRRELTRIGGHVWKTDHSDTEVILHAFEQWGIDCLARLQGMFAFGLWDAHRRQLWLVRDRVGVKPLYYSRHHNRLTYASEIKALLRDPDQPRAVDPEAFFHFLSFLTTPAPTTLFAGISKLPAGTWLRADADGTVTQARYWDAWRNVAPLTGHTEDEIAQQVLADLRRSVQLRKVSDVPVGVFLSGGIDSSTNAALFSEGESQPVRTFSIGYSGAYASYRNELEYARLIAARVGAEHHERVLSAHDVTAFLPDMVELQDEPIADPVCVPVYYVAELARQHGVTVCQLGEGADELFVGYPSWLNALKMQEFDDLPVPSLAKRAALGAASALQYDRTFHFEWLRRGARHEPLFWGGAEAFTHVEKMRLLHPDMRRSLQSLTSWDALAPIHDRFKAGAWEQTHLNWMTYLDLNLRLPELLLMRVDKMTMGASLEARVPFLDHRFVELALGVPSALKVKDGVLKYVLKKAVRGIIPDEIIDRPKQGFGVPVDDLIVGPFRDYAVAHIERFARTSGLLDVDEARRVAQTALGTKVWYLLNAALWHQRFILDDPIDVPAVA